MDNEIILSNNLNQIELEIKWHKENAGKSIWEIGRRLNHVKENDLAHGQFTNWVESQGIQYREANRMMKIADELKPNMSTWSHLGNRALYLIATLPEEAREEEHVTVDGETKTPDEMTVRELQELKKKLTQKDKKIKEQQQVIDDYATKEPEVVEKIVEVEKEVVHPHVEDLRSDNKQLSEALRKAQAEADAAKKRNDFIESQYNQLLEERAEVNENSAKFKQLTEAMENARGDLNRTQKLVSDYKHILKILRQGNEFLLKISGLVYMDISETVNESAVVSREFDSLIRSLERLTRDLLNIRGQNIIEGEFADE